MCGISGKVDLQGRPVDRPDIERMMGAIKHRGPDDEGVFIDGSVGLGFVRLSILDLSSAGHQPMFSHDGNLVIVFNGEVYNYIELREELEPEFKFNSGTDTEVILAAYQKWGEQCLELFNGMFAFVIYDVRTGRLFGARDRFGIKPFYYYLDNDRFLFASEIKAILPFVDCEPNDPAIADYLLYNRVDHSSETFFKGIYKLPHGSSFSLFHGKFQVSTWYSLKDRVRSPRNLTSDDYRNLFSESLKLRQRADVPVGVTLSGGIDSSSITAMLRTEYALEDVNTFSSVYEKGEEADESEYVLAFRDSIRNMHFVTPTAESFLQDLRSFVRAHDEPMPNTSPYVQFKVMELASRHVKVTLDGQGADEQLAGYHNFFSIYFIELAKSGKFMTLLREVSKYARIHGNPVILAYALYYVLPGSFQYLLSRKRYPSIKKEFAASARGHDNIKALYKPDGLNDSLLRHFEYKLEHLLKWEDINSMFHSIESRVPFLDHNLVEATISSPPETKIRDGETKYILREALKDVLPAKVTNRKDKRGFQSPQAKWFRSEGFRDEILSLLNSDSFRSRPYFDQEVALKQFNDHLKGGKDNSRELWKLINMELWLREYIDPPLKN